MTEKRPWGEFTILDEGKNYKVKRLIINSGQCISLQYHKLRIENWIIVSGNGAFVTLGNEHFHLNKEESITIYPYQEHRVWNNGSEPLIIIETQTGEYLGEDEIVRIDDIYGRN